MEAIRIGCTIVLGLLTIFMSTKNTDWKEKHRAWIMLVALVLTVGLVYTSWKVDSESKDKLASVNDQLIVALTKLDDKSTALESEIRNGNNRVMAIQQDNLSLQKKNFALQKEVAEKEELEKKKQADIYAKKESARRNREVNFVTPYKELLYRSEGNIRMMHEGFFNTKYFMDGAKEWLLDMLALLKQHCSDERVWLKFQYPDRQAGILRLFPESWDKRFREEYPFIMNPEWVRFAAFYRLSIEDLEKTDLSGCK